MKGRSFIVATLTPVLFLLLLLSLFPIFYNIFISTTNMSLYHYTDYNFVGIDNYKTLVTSPVSDFFTVALWNIIYSLFSIVLPFVIGVAAAQSLIRLPRPFGVAVTPLLILPWVIPAFITVLIWKGLFNFNFGAINIFLDSLGLSSIPWLIDPRMARLSVILVSVWLGIPFMTVIARSVLKTIPEGIFEAARLDGSGAFTTFTRFTLPLTLRRMLPVLVLGFSASFNNFTAIYLLTAGGPTSPGSIGGAGATDIVISYIFKLTLISKRYGLAAAYAVVIFIFIGFLTIINMRLLKRGREEAF